MDSDLLDDVDSWKGVVSPTKKPRSVGPHKLKPKKTTSKKKTNQKNRKSKSVIVLIPDKPMSVKIQTPEPEESKSGEGASTPQRLVSVAGHLKNHVFIDSGASLHIIFNRELLGGLIKHNRAIKIQAMDKLNHLSQI